MSNLGFGFGIVIGVSLTIYLGVLFILYIEKLNNKQREEWMAQHRVHNDTELEKQLKNDNDTFKKERELLFSKYGIPNFVLCMGRTNIKDYIFVFKETDCIYAFGKNFRCGDYLDVALVDIQKVEIGGRLQFENVFYLNGVLNYHLIGDCLINNRTKEYINIADKTEKMAKDKGLEYYTISHYSYLEVQPLRLQQSGIPFKFKTPVIYNDEEKLNGLIMFFTIATDYSIHLSKERILLLTFLEGFSDKNIFELDDFCVKTHRYIDSDELERDLIRKAIEYNALSNFVSDYEISQITEARNKALNYLADLQRDGKRLITFNDYEYKKKFDGIHTGADISPIVIVDGDVEPPKPSVETIEIDFNISNSFRRLKELS